MSDSLGDNTGQHAEGIQHVASNAAPPGTTDTSRGTEGGVGTGAESSGVSSSDNFQSPLVPGSNSEQTSTDQDGGVIGTVKSYLGMGGSSGSQAAETGQLGSSGETRNVQDDTTGSGSGAGITGAAATAASAVGLGSGNSAAGGGLGSTSASSGVAADDTTTTGSTTGGTGSTLEAAKEKVQETVANTTGADTKPVTSGDDDHKPPQPAGGKPKKMENESAIPTAGGERLGEKHWGESKIVPDNPEKRASEAGISSEAGSAGQPTQQTTDNTAANTGGATGPPGSSSNDGGDGEEKTKMTDKIKDKLHIGKN